MKYKLVGFKNISFIKQEREQSIVILNAFTKIVTCIEQF